MPDNIPRNRPFCYFASFLIVSLTPFINKPDSSSDLTISIISFISLFKIIAASVAAAAAVNPNVIKTILANAFNTFFTKGNPAYSNGPKRLPKSPPDSPILRN